MTSTTKLSFKCLKECIDKFESINYLYRSQRELSRTFQEDTRGIIIYLEIERFLRVPSLLLKGIKGSRIIRRRSNGIEKP